MMLTNSCHLIRRFITINQIMPLHNKKPSAPGAGRSFWELGKVALQASDSSGCLGLEVISDDLEVSKRSSCWH